MVNGVRKDKHSVLWLDFAVILKEFLRYNPLIMHIFCRSPKLACFHFLNLILLLHLYHTRSLHLF